MMINKPNLIWFFILATATGTLLTMPGCQKVREGSREKAVINNLRQIASAGQSYILEEGVTHVTYRQLEGDYFSPIIPVYDESYGHIVIYDEGGVIEAESTKEGRVTFTY